MEKQAARSDSLVRDFKEASKSSESGKMKLKGPVILFVILGLLGVATGYIVAQTTGTKSVSVAPGTEGQGGEVETGAVFGSDDAETFPDEAEGTLREGGIEGEGAYHLERPGGESQNVYMTSSIVDLSSFIGKKVKVWGATFEGEKAGWLMDVGRLEVL